MSEKIELSINGKKVVADKGERLIDVAKREGDYIPRFCYHPKLSVVASCRMCLVDIEGVAKPQPACATYVCQDMTVRTQSKKAIDAQKAIMQFLLINHPLNCPICDQGGECELQDTAMGYGEGVSEYTEDKRTVEDEDLGPLVATEMSLCIHCTRCVRFGKEIAGIADLGLVGRGDTAMISTYLNTGLKSELSGNMIDLCPVGALTSKPFKFKGRSWGFKQHLGISPHDCVGSNLAYHTIAKGYDHLSDVIRVLPYHQPTLNDTWLSDRDRFSYEGVNSDKRLSKPLVRKGSGFEEIDWADALLIVSEKLNAYKDAMGVWASSSATCEEGYLIQKLFNKLGVLNIDAQLLRNDTHTMDLRPYDIPPEDIVSYDTIVLVGSNIRYEQPMLSIKIKKACEKGASIHSIGSIHHDYYFDHTHHMTSVQTLAKKVYESCQLANEEGILKGKVLWILGEEAWIHPQASKIQSIIHKYCEHQSSHYMVLAPGANTLGLHALGCHPGKEGLGFQQMLDKPLKMIWMHQVDPLLDTSDPKRAYEQAKSAFTVALSSFDTEGIRDCADLILPLAATCESPGSFINYMGLQQSFKSATAPKHEAKMGFSIYDVLYQILFETQEQKYEAISKQVSQIYSQIAWPEIIPDTDVPKVIDAKWQRLGLSHHVRLDMQLRHAESLQKAYPIEAIVYCADQETYDQMLAHIPNIQVSNKVAPGVLFYERATVFYGASCGEVGLEIDHE